MPSVSRMKNSRAHIRIEISPCDEKEQKLSLWGASRALKESNVDTPAHLRNISVMELRTKLQNDSSRLFPIS